MWCTSHSAPALLLQSTIHLCVNFEDFDVVNSALEEAFAYTLEGAAVLVVLRALY
jgi:hypothetical protein